MNKTRMTSQQPVFCKDWTTYGTLLKTQSTVKLFLRITLTYRNRKVE